MTEDDKKYRQGRSIWNFIVKHEFWFTILPVIGLYIGEYLTRTHWMGNLGFLLFLIAITRLASHPMWKKDKEKNEKSET